jgi:putative phosphoesterase
VKVAIVSDIHANLAALLALPGSYDELWVLGDLVNYGPSPAEVVDWVRAHADVVIRGNHDHALGFGCEPLASPRFREMARATQHVSESLLTPAQKSYLKQLPLRAELKREETRFYLCHAIPSDPLYSYCEAESEHWAGECEKIQADVLLVGHTHIPFVRRMRSCTIVNPGSLGQPKSGAPEACYAVWENGKAELKTYSYPIERTVADIRSLPLPGKIQDELISVLRTGRAPAGGVAK